MAEKKPMDLATLMTLSAAADKAKDKAAEAQKDIARAQKRASNTQIDAETAVAAFEAAKQEVEKSLANKNGR